jgi:fluoride exporter
MFGTLLQVAAGGAIGATLRYLAGHYAALALGRGFPWGTLAVNLAGSAAMGVLYVLAVERTGARFAPFLLAGVLGGFTTFSAFSLDAFALFESGRRVLAAGYVLGSVAGALAGLALGVWATRAALA